MDMNDRSEDEGKKELSEGSLKTGSMKWSYQE